MAKRRVVVIRTVIALVIVGGVILGTQCSSSPADVVDGPGMLYFYAEW
jgi:hypothetical protein